MEAAAVWSGWLAASTIVLAALVPLAHRLYVGRRAPSGSGPIRMHVRLGLATAACAFLHTMAVLPALGSPAAIAGGLFAMLPAGAAFFLLVAHAGLGLALRDPKLKDRVRKRRTHTTTALLIAVTVGAHVAFLLRAQ